MDDKKHIVAITAFIKNHEGDKFLILKRHENEVAYPGMWAFPGGKLEKGQTIMDTLVREVQEEAGIDIEDDYKKYLKDFTFTRPDGHNVVGVCFEVRAKSNDVKIDDDFEDFAWISPDDMSSYNCIPGMDEEVKLAFCD